MAAVAVAVLWLAQLVGAPRWLAVVLAILAAVSIEPTSYPRQGIRRWRGR
jgi:hypothetical protein